ncbi:MAG: hypothetical protein AB2720_05040, partial [Candidatus Thiodiazotropha taylori]
ALFFLSKLTIEIFLKIMLTFSLCFNAVHKKSNTPQRMAVRFFSRYDRTKQVRGEEYEEIENYV